MKKENVKKAPTMPKKLEKEWVAYVIDTMAGPTLMMVSMREPDRAAKLQGILVQAINQFYKKKRNEIPDPTMMMRNIQNIVIELTATFLDKQLAHTLENGMPERPKIIQPRQVGMPPMGRA